MPYNNIDDGLYLAKQAGAVVKGYPVTHYGIIDIGNVLECPQIDKITPTVVHQTPPQVKLEYVSSKRPWEIIDRITDIVEAKKRIEKAVKNPKYDLFENNCEHFANYVAKANKSSGQIVIGAVATLGTITLLITSCIWLAKRK